MKRWRDRELRLSKLIITMQLGEEEQMQSSVICLIADGEIEEWARSIEKDAKLSERILFIQKYSSQIATRGERERLEKQAAYFLKTEEGTKMIAAANRENIGAPYRGRQGS